MHFEIVPRSQMSQTFEKCHYLWLFYACMKVNFSFNLKKKSVQKTHPEGQHHFQRQLHSVLQGVQKILLWAVHVCRQRVGHHHHPQHVGAGTATVLCLSWSAVRPSFLTHLCVARARQWWWRAGPCWSASWSAPPSALSKRALLLPSRWESWCGVTTANWWISSRGTCRDNCP